MIDNAAKFKCLCVKPFLQDAVQKWVWHVVLYIPLFSTLPPHSLCRRQQKQVEWSWAVKIIEIRPPSGSMAIYGNLWQSMDHDEYQYVYGYHDETWNIKGTDSAAPLASKYRSLKPSAWRAKVTCRAVG